MLGSLYEHFYTHFPAIVAFYDMSGPEFVSALMGALPQADNAFNRFMNRGK